MDDRILYVPPSFCPYVDTFRQWRAAEALLADLSAFLPVDYFTWPTARGYSQTALDWRGAAEAFRQAVRPNHHVVESLTGEAMLVAMATAPQPPRSLVSAGFFPSPATLRAYGAAPLAAATEGVYQIYAGGPTQLVPLCMQGAGEPEMRAAVERVDEVLDRKQLASLMESMKRTNFIAELTTQLSSPALFITLPLTVPGREEALEVYRMFAPQAQSDEVFDFPLHLQEEDGGHELAATITAYIKKVIGNRPPDK